ncbi:MAG: hypothetical protein IIX48_05225 [Lachnospiraceae bacterium]|nr:hypothetical protein [Lachnospiraceae bacterium]
MIDRMLAQYDMETDANKRNRLLGGAAVVGAYIKRYGNLLLISECTETADIRDLFLYRTVDKIEKSRNNDSRRRRFYEKADDTHNCHCNFSHRSNFHVPTFCIGADRGRPWHGKPGGTYAGAVECRVDGGG